LFNALSDTRVPPNPLTERLFTRRYADSLLELGDRNLFLAGMMHWVGFTQIGHEVKKGSRRGRSSYTFWRRIALLVEAVTSFSAVPLRLLFYLGALVTSVALILSFYLLINKILYPNTILLGFTSLLVVILFSLGVIMSSIGLVGLYLSKIFRQIQNRPLFIVKNVYL
jgi:putative glycosyltransferase